MGTLRLHYEENNILRPIGAFFLLKLKIPIQNRATVKIFLGPYDSLFDSEGVFRQAMGIRKIWSLSNRLS